MINFTAKRFGMMITSARTKKKLTRYALAQLVKMSETQIKALEDGNANPTMSSMHTITKALDIKVVFSFNQKSLSL
jgi:ribosome-binding protein aMBF1 (putative translation factor)